MEVKSVRSLGLPKGVPVNQFTTMAEATKHHKNGELGILDVINKYGRQKDSLVNARDWLSGVVDKTLSFPVWDKKTKKPLLGTDKDEPETESSHIERFVDGVVSGKVSVPAVTLSDEVTPPVPIKAFTPVGKDDKEKTASVWIYLQSLVDAHAPWSFDLNAATRVGGKAKNPPKFALDGATSIFSGGDKKIAEFTKKFTEGYKRADGIVIDGFAFAPFNTVAPAGANAADVEKVRQTNLTNLAWAIVTAEEQVRAKSAAKEY